MREATDTVAFDEAIEVAERLRRNVETVVLGKSETITLVVAALASRGHVLLEDVPGTAKTVLARAIAGSIDGAVAAPDPVHARPAADGHHRAFDLEPAGSRLRVPRRSRLRERAARRRGEPRAAEGAVGAARGDGRAAGHRRRHDAHAARAVLPDRDREPDRAGRHVPAARGAARPVPPSYVARVPERRRRGAHPRRPAARPSAEPASPGHRAGGARRHSSPRSRRCTSTRCSSAGSSTSCARRASSSSSRSARRFAGRLALERAARAWALLHGRPFVAPEDVEALFLPVIGHRLVLAPELVLDEDLTRQQAIERVFAAAPGARAAARARLGRRGAQRRPT